MLENFDQVTLQGIYELVANEYGITQTYDQALQDSQIIELLELTLSELTITPNVVKTPLENEKTIITLKPQKLTQAIEKRTIKKKGKRKTKINKVKTLNSSVSDHSGLSVNEIVNAGFGIVPIKDQHNVHSDNYLYVYDRRITLEITPNGTLTAIDKKQKVKIMIGKFISYHPDYTFIVNNHSLSLNLLLTIQTFIGQLRNVTQFTSNKLEDLRYWLTFRDPSNAVTVELSKLKSDQDFSIWYSTQTYTSLKNWVKRQAKKGINTQNWYIKLDSQKLIDDSRIKEIWLTVNGYDLYNLDPKLR